MNLLVDAIYLLDLLLSNRRNLEIFSIFRKLFQNIFVHTVFANFQIKKFYSFSFASTKEYNYRKKIVNAICQKNQAFILKHSCTKFYILEEIHPTFKLS